MKEAKTGRRIRIWGKQSPKGGPANAYGGGRHTRKDGAEESRRARQSQVKGSGEADKEAVKARAPRRRSKSKDDDPDTITASPKKRSRRSTPKHGDPDDVRTAAPKTRSRRMASGDQDESLLENPVKQRKPKAKAKGKARASHKADGDKPRRRSLQTASNKVKGSDTEDDHLRDSDFDSSDLDAVLMAVGGQDGFEESGLMAERWHVRRRNKKKKARRAAAAEMESSEDGEHPRVKRVRDVNCQASPAARSLLAQGQAHFAAGNFEAAIEVMRSAIREQPGLADPYHVLHLIYEETGDSKKSLDALILSAYFTSPASEARPIWRKAADLSISLGLTDQACYAYKRSINQRGRRGDDDLKNMWELSQLLFQKGSTDRGIEILFEIYEETEEPELACEVARKLVARRRWKECISLLEAAVEKGRVADPPRVDLNTLNMLCEVLLIVREFEKCARVLIKLLNLTTPEGNSSSSSSSLAIVPVMDEEALTAKLKSSPVDLVGKLGAALCRLPQSESDEGDADPLCSAAIEVVLSHPPETHHDLYLLLVDAMLADEGTTATTISQRWRTLANVRPWSAKQAQRILNLLETWPGLEEDLRERQAICLWRVGKVEEAALQLEALLEDPGDRPDNELRDLRVRAAEAWIEQGSPDRADNILSSVSYEDLQRSTRLPQALSAANRRSIYQELSEQLEKALSEAAGDPSGWMHKHLGSDEDVQSFISRFRHLVYDCELDFKRLSSYTSNAVASSARVVEAEEPAADEVEAGEEATSSKGDDAAEVNTLVAYKKPPKSKRVAKEDIMQVASVAHKMKRRHLGLDSIEDMFGFEAYTSLVLRGVDMIRSYANCLGRSRQSTAQTARAVELCEMILTNRRLISVRNPVKRRMMRTLAMKSLSVGFEARLWRVVFKHLRGLCDQTVHDDVMALFARVLFTHADVDSIPTSSSVRKADDGGPTTWDTDKAFFSASGHRSTYASHFTDVRSWALRKLLRRPRSYGLTLLAGHFCIVASQYPYAVAEYSRAHRLAPNDALPSLCCATAYMSFAMSRAAVHRHDLVLKGLTFLQRYRRLRLREAGEEGESEAEEEVVASWGGPTSRQAWELLPSDDPLDLLALRAESAYNFGRAFHQLSINALAAEAYQSALEILEGCPEAQRVCRTDLKVLRHSAAFNLAAIFRAQGSMSLASEVLWRHVVF